MSNRFLVTYTKEFLGYGDGDLGGADYNYTLNNVYDTYKVSPASVERLKRAFQKDIASRKHQAEGRFFTTETIEGLEEKWQVTVRDGVLVRLEDVVNG